MLGEEDRLKICGLGKEFGVRQIIVFGTSAVAGVKARDIDLAVEGLAPEKFFQFYGRLLLALSKPVDLIDLDEESTIVHAARARGLRVYG